MYKSVKMMTWIVVAIMMLNASKHFLSDNMFTYMMLLLLVAVIVNIVGLAFKKD
ncbi:hypothetical protein [Flavobacterium foetidum]|uniref:hypothetical protein n=1 Tax=Flavobacterium foetidum TaxID=2026681 RepID=UPI0013C2BD67|nr:hypothetical protein [Flavobacterium foetidum]KAF2509869.1 hypothetical protein E0W73_18375 [Flavobacterium foetidum]